MAVSRGLNALNKISLCGVINRLSVVGGAEGARVGHTNKLETSYHNIRRGTNVCGLHTGAWKPHTEAEVKFKALLGTFGVSSK